MCRRRRRICFRLPPARRERGRPLLVLRCPRTHSGRRPCCADGRCAPSVFRGRPRTGSASAHSGGSSATPDRSAPARTHGRHSPRPRRKRSRQRNGPECPRPACTATNSKSPVTSQDKDTLLMTSFADALDQKIVVLDGGLATQLEEQGHDLRNSLWSARLLRDEPDEIVAAHRAYVEAGADVAITASYHASYTGFANAGIGADEATQIGRAHV